MAAEGKPRWSTENILDLIQLFRNRPCLYNRRLDSYKNAKVKEKAMKEIAEQMGTTVEYVHKKIKVLRVLYVRERRKMLETDEDKDQTPYESGWMYFKALNFLEKYSRPGGNPRKSAKDKKEIPDMDNPVEYQRGPVHEDVNITYHEQEPDTREINKQSSEPFLIYAAEPHQITKIDSVPRESHVHNCLSTPRNSLDHIDDEDEIFSKYVVSQLRKIDDDNEKIFVKHKIQTVLFESLYRKRESEGIVELCLN